MSTDNFNANHFLDLSKEIEDSITNGRDIKRLNKSALIRSAISRAYYSTFLSLRESILKNQQWKVAIKEGKDDHERLRLTLFSLPALGFRPIANDFNNLRKRRNNADYDLPPTFNAEISHVTRSNLEANKIIQNIPLLTNYLSTHYP